MKIKSYKKLKNNRYQIFFDDTTNLILYDEIILKQNLLLKKELSKKEAIELIKENKKLESYYAALQFLAHKNRSKKEVADYLLSKNYQQSDILQVISTLEEKNLLNSSLYLDAFIHDEIALTNHGPQKIKNKLLKLGFVEEEIDKHLQKVENSVWEEKIKKFFNKKIQSNHKDSKNALKEKLIYTGIQEGFSKAMISSIFETLEIPENDDILKKEASKLYKKLSNKYKENELWFQLKGKLLNKGFSYEEVNTTLEDIKKTSI